MNDEKRATPKHKWLIGVTSWDWSDLKVVETVLTEKNTFSILLRSHDGNKFHIYTNTPDVYTNGSHMKHVLSWNHGVIPHCQAAHPWDCFFPNLEAIFRDFRGRTLVVAGAKEGMPFFAVQKVGGRVVPDRGIEAMLLECLANSLNFT